MGVRSEGKCCRVPPPTPPACTEHNSKSGAKESLSCDPKRVTPQPDTAPVPAVPPLMLCDHRPIGLGSSPVKAGGTCPGAHARIDMIEDGIVNDGQPDASWSSRCWTTVATVTARHVAEGTRLSVLSVAIKHKQTNKKASGLFCFFSLFFHLFFGTLPLPISFIC